MDRLFSALLWTVIGLTAAIILGLALYLLPGVQQLPFWLAAVRISSWALLALCLVLITTQITMTSHPHQDAWLLATGGMILAVTGMAITPARVATVLTTLAILVGAVLVTLTIAQTRTGFDRLVERPGFAWLRRTAQVVHLLWLLLCCAAATGTVGAGIYFLSRAWLPATSGAYGLAAMIGFAGGGVTSFGAWLLACSIRAIRNR